MFFDFDSATGAAPGFAADDGTSSQDASAATSNAGAGTSSATTNDVGTGTATADSTDAGAGAVAAPTPDYVNAVLTGAVGISKVSEAAAILVGAEVALDAIEPIGAVLEVAHMVLAVWDALETPDRTCGYQGLVYGLMCASLGMDDPQPNPTWPNLSDAPEHDQRFLEGVAEAKKRLADGLDGVRRKNLILLDIAKRNEKAVINDLWQHAISDDDHLLRMFTINWPNVDPNG